MKLTRRAVPFVCVLLTMLAFSCTKAEEVTDAPKPVPTVQEVLDRAVADLKKNDLDAAIRGFGLIVENASPGAPQKPQAHMYLGQIAYRGGNMQLAAENFAAAYAEAPGLVQAGLFLGNAQFADGKLNDAVATWEKLAADHPGLAAAHNNLGVAYLDLDDPDKAILHLEAGIALTPDNVRTHENLASAYKKKGMTAEAEAARRKAAAIKARTRPAGG